MVTIDDVRPFALSLPRSYEVLVRDRVKFRVGRIVYVAFSRDETQMGFGFPKEERAALVASEPDKFLLPKQSDMRSSSTPGAWSSPRRSPPPTTPKSGRGDGVARRMGKTVTPTAW